MANPPFELRSKVQFQVVADQGAYDTRVNYAKRCITLGRFQQVIYEASSARLHAIKTFTLGVNKVGTGLVLGKVLGHPLFRFFSQYAVIDFVKLLPVMSAA